MTSDAPETIPEAFAELRRRADLTRIDVPGGRARIRLEVTDGEDLDAVIWEPALSIEPAREECEFDALLSADAATWRRISADVRAGMDAFRSGRLTVRENLNLGVGFLAATGGEESTLRMGRLDAGGHSFSYAEAGEAEHGTLLCLPGLGGTKASFLTTLSAIGPEGYRVIALDLPGFGDSDKPLNGAYDAVWFAEAVIHFIDGLGLERVHLAGNSMGGRVAIEVALQAPERVGRLALITPSLAWLKPRQWDWLLKLPLPKLGLLQPTPRQIVEPLVRRLVPGASHGGWSAAGVDEWLRSYLTAGGRYAFYEAARNIYMEEPHGENGFWDRLEGLQHDSLFIWGTEDMLVPIAFMHHVEERLPAARHLELACGHVPQLELPDETHAAILEHLST